MELAVFRLVMISNHVVNNNVKQCGIDMRINFIWCP